MLKAMRAPPFSAFVYSQSNMNDLRILGCIFPHSKHRNAQHTHMHPFKCEMLRANRPKFLRCKNPERTCRKNTMENRDAERRRCRTVRHEVTRRYKPSRKRYPDWEHSGFLCHGSFSCVPIVRVRPTEMTNRPPGVR